MRLTLAEVTALAVGAGLTGDAAATAAAIAGWAGSPSAGESGGNPTALGDLGLQTGVWGPSVGLWQVRSLNSERGTGRARDADALLSPTFNAASMVTISAGGTNWRPWTVYTSGAYKANLPAARAHLNTSGGGGGVPMIGAVTAAGTSAIGDLFGAVASGAWWRRVGLGVLGVVLIGLGLGILGADLWRAVQ